MTSKGTSERNSFFPFDLWKVPPSRCYNYDETSVFAYASWNARMEGQRGTGHGSNRRRAPVHCGLGDTNGVRFALILPNFPEGCYFAQFAFGVADKMLCACTETHWQTMESVLAFVTFLDNKLQGQSSAPDPWVFVIDVAPVHTAYAFRSALPKHSSTSVAQPADVGVMKPFKDVLPLCAATSLRPHCSTPSVQVEASFSPIGLHRTGITCLFG